MIFNRLYDKIKKKGVLSLKKNQIVVLVSVILAVAAAVTTVILVLKHLEKKKAQIAPANLAFETDFTEEAE